MRSHNADNPLPCLLSVAMFQLRERAISPNRHGDIGAYDFIIVDESVIVIWL